MLSVYDLIVLSISAFGFYHAIQVLRSSKLNFKPFNCKICLSFWYAIGSIVAYNFYIVKVIVISLFITGIVHIIGFIEKYMEVKNDSI